MGVADRAGLCWLLLLAITLHAPRIESADAPQPPHRIVWAGLPKSQWRKHASSSRASRTTHSPDCVCFATCTLAQTRRFLERMPRFVNTSTSPWYGYLRAVYGPAVPLPFALDSLRWIYHGSAHWASAHPGVVWPMADCISSPPPCAPAECARWTAGADNRLPPAAVTLRKAIVYPFLADGAHKTSGGTSLGTRWESAAAEPPPAPPRAWVEVTPMHIFAGIIRRRDDTHACCPGL